VACSVLDFLPILYTLAILHLVVDV
jgi:hypothetical protein